jgi:hypothetical protein
MDIEEDGAGKKKEGEGLTRINSRGKVKKRLQGRKSKGKEGKWKSKENKVR